MSQYLLFRDLVDLLGVGHVLEYMLVPILEELGDVVEREALVLRNLDPAAVLALDALLAAIDQVLQEVHRDLLIGRQVYASIYGQEIVDLPFRIVLGGEGLRADLLSLWCLILRLWNLLVVHGFGLIYK